MHIDIYGCGKEEIYENKHIMCTCKVFCDTLFVIVAIGAGLQAGN